MQIPFLQVRSARYNADKPLPGAQTCRRGEVQAGEELLCGYDLTGRFFYFVFRVNRWNQFTSNSPSYLIFHKCFAKVISQKFEAGSPNCALYV